MSSPDYNLALREIEKFTKVFRAFDESKNALIALASLDQATKETQFRKDKLTEEYSLEQKAFADFKKNSTQEIEKLNLAYKQKKESLEAKYLEREKKLEENFGITKQTKESIVTNLSSKIKELGETLDNLTSLISFKQEELTSLEKRLSEVRQTISSLLNR